MTYSVIGAGAIGSALALHFVPSVTEAHEHARRSAGRPIAAEKHGFGPLSTNVC